MIEKLTKSEDPMFQEKYEGERCSKRVICILDDNCVRFVGFVNNKRVVRREYANNKKALCMARAIAWLNK
jgi:hypothetical protein